MMSMNICVLLLVVCGVALGNPLEQSERATLCYTSGYTGLYQTGSFQTFQEYVPDLNEVGFDDEICSVRQTGMWIYYEDPIYNSRKPAQVFWVHGIDIEDDLPVPACGVISSLKYGGNRYELNEDSYTVYTGENFTESEYYGHLEIPDLEQVVGGVSSLILTGVSPWTFYTGYGYTGDSYCFYPDTDVDVSPNATILNFGLFPSLPSVGVPDNSFMSVEMGCYSDNIISAPQMKAEKRLRNGAWGVLNP